MSKFESSKVAGRPARVVHWEGDPPVDLGVDCSVDEFGNPLPSMTVQAEKDACDINRIMARYSATGLLDDGLLNDGGRFADVASVADYHTAQSIIISATEAFQDLPVKVRRRFQNDPVQFLQFVDSLNSGDVKIIAEARELGLLKPLEPASGASAAPGQGAGGGAPAQPAGGVSKSS